MLNVAGELERKLSQRVVMLFSMHSTDGKINGNSIDANPRQKLDFNHIGLTYNIYQLFGPISCKSGRMFKFKRNYD